MAKISEERRESLLESITSVRKLFPEEGGDESYYLVCMRSKLIVDENEDLRQMVEGIDQVDAYLNKSLSETGLRFDADSGSGNYCLDLYAGDQHVLHLHLEEGEYVYEGVEQFREDPRMWINTAGNIPKDKLQFLDPLLEKIDQKISELGEKLSACNSRIHQLEQDAAKAAADKRQEAFEQAFLDVIDTLHLDGDVNVDPPFPRGEVEASKSRDHTLESASEPF